MPNLPLRKYNLFFPVLVILLAACHREKPQKSRTEIITASPWKYYQAGLDLDNNGTIDTTLRADLLPVCYTDNMLTFKADSIGILDENINRCLPSRPQTSSFTWYFLNNETEIFMSAMLLPLFEGTFKIVELTDTKFSITRLVGVHGFPSYLTYVVVYVH